jgi:hypothetical protein
MPRSLVSASSKSTPLSNPPRRQFSLARRHFSTPNENPNSNPQSNHLLEIWRGLNRPAKVVIVLFFSIAGMIETTFWVNVAWVKIQGWRGKEVEDGSEEGEGAVRKVWRRWFWV